MRLIALISLLLLLLIVALTMFLDGAAKGTVTRARRPRDPGVTDEQAAVFEVLDELFPYEVEQRPFVEVELGHPRGVRDGSYRAAWPNYYRSGFLLADDGKTFRVQFLDGERAHLTASPAGTPAWCRTRYAPADLLAHALVLAAKAGRPGSLTGPSYGEPITVLTRALLAARALARLGRADDCAAVWRSLPPSSRTLEGLLPKSETGGLMTWPFAEDLANRVALDVDDLTLSWGELLERHDRFLARVASDSHSARKVRERRDAIARVLGGSGWSLWESATDKTIEELRNTARPQSGGSWAGTSSVERFEPDPAAQAAFDRIVAAGLDRVPELIAALEDRSPSRSVFFYAGKGGRFIEVEDVRTVATQALRMLYGGDEVIRTPSVITRMEVDDWRDWYARVKQGGLRAFLAAKMLEEADAGDAAHSYLTLWPEDGAPVVDAMAGANDSTWLDLLAVLDSSAATQRGARERIVAMLRATAATASWRRSFAASALLQLGDEHGAKLLGEARQRGENLTPEEWFVLLDSGLAEPWQAIERRLEDPIDRAGLLHVVQLSSREEILERADAAARSTIDETLRRCLLQLLTDTETWVGSSCTATGTIVVHGRQRVSMDRASVADLAACALAVGWPGEFAFDPIATGSERRRQILQMLRQAGRAPSAAAPTEVPGAGDVVGTLLFEGDALPDEAQVRIKALVGKPLEVGATVAMLRGICSQNDKVVALHCEQRRGSSMIVRCACRPVTDEDRKDAPVRTVCTRAGDTERWRDEFWDREAPEFSLIVRP